MKNGPQLFGVTVVIVEDQRMVAEFLALHCRELRMRVLAVCGTLAEGLAAVKQHTPELLLMDFSLPDGSGLDACAKILEERPAQKILGISSHQDPWTMLQVQRIGLQGFVDKHEQDPAVLTEAMSKVMRGEIYYTPVVSRASTDLRKDPKSFNRLLSEHEIRVLSLIGESKSDEEIGALLGISPSTCQSRRRDIMRKLDIHSTPKLIHYAIVNGLTRPHQLERRP